MSTITTTGPDNSDVTASLRSAAEQTYSSVIFSLRDHPCVSFALSCRGFVHWSPELDAAVRLMQIVTYRDPTPVDQVITNLDPSWVTPQRIEAAETALIDCISLLKNSGHPFTLLAHVDGHREIEYHFIRDGQQLPLATIAEAVAADVRCFGQS